MCLFCHGDTDASKAGGQEEVCGGDQGMNGERGDEVR